MVAVNFESWLIGFIEGEGSFSSNRGRYPVFSLAQKYRQVMDITRELFGVGTVYHAPSTDTWKYSVYGKACWPVRLFCDGNLQLRKKVAQFDKWIQLKWPQNVSSKQYSFQFNFEDWLIGFIEAEGSFTRLGNGIYPEFSVAQKDEKEVIERIQRFFGCGTVKETGNKVAWQLRITGRGDCQKVRAFCEGRLQLEKRQIQFEAWKKLNWIDVLEVRRKDKRFAQFAVAHPDGTFFYGVDASGKKTVLNV